MTIRSLNCRVTQATGDTALKNIFEKISMLSYKSSRVPNPAIAELAIKFLMPFVMTYKSEAGFSTLVFLKINIETG